MAMNLHIHGFFGSYIAHYGNYKCIGYKTEKPTCEL